jgi:hypothetical protein
LGGGRVRFLRCFFYHNSIVHFDKSCIHFLIKSQKMYGRPGRRGRSHLELADDE